MLPPNVDDAYEAFLDDLADRLRLHELIHGDAIAQERERRRLERTATPDNRHERRKRAAIDRKQTKGVR